MKHRRSEVADFHFGGGGEARLTLPPRMETISASRVHVQPGASWIDPDAGK
jgi:hypothetical protein